VVVNKDGFGGNGKGDSSQDYRFMIQEGVYKFSGTKAMDMIEWDHNKNRMRRIVALVMLSAPAACAQFGYDSKQPFDTTCQELGSRNDAQLRGCGFTGPRGGRVHLILVVPKNVKP
jgi:hypothetical protein